MNESQTLAIEEIQKMAVRLLATNPAGHGLCLIGGFRYRFLDESVRKSRAIQYHWEGDLAAKQSEMVSLFRRRLQPDVKRRLGYDGDVRAAIGPDSDSALVKVVELAFWKADGVGRIEIPVDITRIVCHDPVTVRTTDGVVYPTPSDADLIEAKVIALFNRQHIQHRDMVDLFLFGNHLRPDSAERLREKFATLSIHHETVRRQLQDFERHPDYHRRSIAAVIAEQLDSTAAANIESAGGAKMVFDSVRQLLATKLKLGGEQGP